MSGMEFISEAVELTEGTEMSGLLEQKEAILGQLEAAQEAENVEKANYFRGELGRLEAKLAEQGSGTMELAEDAEMSGLLEQKEVLLGQLEAAQEAGNMEKANYFRGELARLEERLTQQKGSEISFGMNRLGTYQG